MYPINYTVVSLKHRSPAVSLYTTPPHPATIFVTRISVARVSHQRVILISCDRYFDLGLEYASLLWEYVLILIVRV